MVSYTWGTMEPMDVEQHYVFKESVTFGLFGHPQISHLHVHMFGLFRKPKGQFVVSYALVIPQTTGEKNFFSKGFTCDKTQGFKCGDAREAAERFLESFV